MLEGRSEWLDVFLCASHPVEKCTWLTPLAAFHQSSCSYMLIVSPFPVSSQQLSVTCVTEMSVSAIFCRAHLHSNLLRWSPDEIFPLVVLQVIITLNSVLNSLWSFPLKQVRIDHGRSKTRPLFLTAAHLKCSHPSLKGVLSSSTADTWT